jgi:tetratricopeptide (TPR) repeat protein
MRVATLLVVFAALALVGVWAFGWYDFSGHLAAARTASAEGRLFDAIHHIQLCQSTHPDDRAVLLIAARVYRQSGAHEQCAELLDRYWRLYGDDDDLALERLLLTAAADDTDTVAAILVLRATTGGETAAQCRYALVSGYLREYRYDSAERTLDQWQADEPQAPLQAILRGKLHEQLFQYHKAEQTYLSVVERQPEHLDARLRLVRVLMEQRKADDALVQLRFLRDRLPTHSEVMLQRALALRQVGRITDAASALDETLEQHPDSAPALTERASIALSEGEDQFAADLLERAVKVDPGSVGARNLLSQAYTRLGRSGEVAQQEEAVRELTADSMRLTELTHGPLHVRPTDPGPPFEIAGIALRAGQVKEAIHWYQIALKRDPSHAQSHAALAVIYRQTGDPVLATQHRALAAGGK